MPAQFNILDRGFKNIHQDGKITGFQVLVKDSYYRGIYIPIIDSFDVTVDGETLMRDQVRPDVTGPGIFLNLIIRRDTRTHLKNMDHIRGQDAGRRKNTAYTVLCEAFEPVCNLCHWRDH